MAFNVNLGQQIFADLPGDFSKLFLCLFSKPNQSNVILIKKNKNEIINVYNIFLNRFNSRTKGEGCFKQPSIFIDWRGFRSPNLAQRLANIILITKKFFFRLPHFFTRWLHHLGQFGDNFQKLNICLKKKTSKMVLFCITKYCIYVIL